MLEAAHRSGLPIDARELSAEELAGTLQQLAESGVRRVAVTGGDGTIALAADLASKLRIELAVIRGGTLNHLARDLGIPEDVDEAVRLAVSGEARPVDAGSVNGHLFLNTSSVGAYASFVSLREHLERYLGYRLASIVAAFRLFAQLRVFTVEAEIEGKMQFYVTPLVFVGVGERELKLPKLGGRAPGGQRGLHVMIVRGRSRARIAALAFAAAARGTQSVARSPVLEAFLVRQFAIRLRRPRIRVATDGEVHMMVAPLEYRWLPDAVSIVVPGGH